MHTFTGKNGTIFIFNSDFSGDMHIKDKDMNEVTIDGADFLKFVSEKVELGDLDLKDIKPSSFPDWEICWSCSKRNTVSCDPSKCDPLDI